ncbi:Amine oxidase [Dillenia turbinata]|uniref:Amine oxidase n=1 Tax=Dillenia turbinata TaxID=194707 RepID=A0AAN8ZPE9_9MAGN
MVVKKPRIVIVGAGMAGLTAANKLYTCKGSEKAFELCVVEGGNRIGGRINSSEFCGDRIEMGATWIHGILGSPVHKIAREINSLESDEPWECMDNFPDEPLTVAEGGCVLNPSIVEPVSTLFEKFMDFAQGKLVESCCIENKGGVDYCELASKVPQKLSIGSFLRKGLESYWDLVNNQREEEGELKVFGKWNLTLLQEGIFAMYENIQRTYTSAGDLLTLDFNSESEYRMFPGEEITIAKGYLSIIESLASVLPSGLIQLGKKVSKIEWLPEGHNLQSLENGNVNKPVKLHFCDGSVMYADHVIVTVSLGVLKAGIQENSSLFSPTLPAFKVEAIKRLGFGVVNKLFLQLSPTHDWKSWGFDKFPFLHMVFHRSDSGLRHLKIPWWMRRTASLCPIYRNSSVLLSWFAGDEALELESLSDEEIISGVSNTISNFLANSQQDKEMNSESHHVNCNDNLKELMFTKVLKSQWGSDPLFMGSYSYVAVGSSGDDWDSMAEPLPKASNCGSVTNSPPLQILFAGEATHRTHYSTTHGAYFSGIREANRLLQHYNCGGVSELLHH